MSNTRKNRQAISLRVDTEVLAWFKRQGTKGYQTLMNEVLEQHVREKIEKSFMTAGRAQELYRKYYAQCFWHLDPNLKIVPDNIQIVLDGLRKYGGREGFILAEELCQ